MSKYKCISDLLDNPNLDPDTFPDDVRKSMLLPGSDLQYENLKDFINKCKGDSSKDELISDELGAERYQKNRNEANVKLYEGIWDITKYLIEIPNISDKKEWTEPTDKFIFDILCKVGRDKIITIGKNGVVPRNIENMGQKTIPLQYKSFHMGRKKKSHKPNKSHKSKKPKKSKKHKKPKNPKKPDKRTRNKHISGRPKRRTNRKKKKKS